MGIPEYKYEANNTIGNDDLLNKNYTLAEAHKNDLWRCFAQQYKTTIIALNDMLAVQFYGLYGYTNNKIIQANSCIKQFHEFKKYFG